MKKRGLFLFFCFSCAIIFFTINETESKIAGHVVISEFSTRGPGGSTDEFVELYNPTDEPVDISGWAIWTYNASSLFCPGWCKRIQFPGAPGSNTTVMPPKRYLLVADSCGSWTGPAPDYWFFCTIGFKDDNGTVRLVMDSDGINSTIDTVAWGKGHFAEGGNPAPNRGYNDDAKSVARKSSASSNESTMSPGWSEYFWGNGRDTDNNGADFFVKSIREPQGLNDPPEPPYDVIFDFKFTEGGFHTLDIRAYDCLGNMVYDNESFHVDTPPVITKLVGEPNCTIAPGLEYCVTTETPVMIDVDFGCCDEGMVVYNNGSAWVDITDVLPFVHYFGEECDHWLNVTVTDCFGRLVYDNESFHVDDTLPVITKVVGDPNCAGGYGADYCVTKSTPILVYANDLGCCNGMTVEYRLDEGIWEPLSNVDLNDHVVISEFSTRGPGGSTDEFVELYNPTDEPVDISGWAIWNYNASAIFCPGWCKSIQFPGAPGSNTTVMPPRRYLLVAESCGSWTGPPPDYWFFCTVGFKDTNGTIRLVMDSDGINSTVDTVAWSIGPWVSGHFAEGGNPAPNRGYNDSAKSVARKASASSNESTMSPGGSEYFWGNGWDTDNNGADFFVKSIREPQGLNDPPEPPYDFIFNFKSSEEGFHTFDIRAYDCLGNLVYDNESFVVDDTPPIIEKTVGDPNISHGNDEWTIETFTPITINVSTGDGCPEKIVEYRIWNATNDTGWIEILLFPFVCTIDERGTHNLSIRAFDCLGNILYDNETFHVDDTYPLINKTIGDPYCTITGDLEYCVTTGTVITINASDAGCCDSLTVLYRVWNGTGWSPDWMDITGSVPFDVSFYEGCEHWLNITAYDCLGHRVWDNETFYVELDCTFPTIEKTIGEPNRSVGCFEFEVSRDTPITINASDNGCCPSFTVEYRIWNSTSDTGWMVIGTDLLPYTFTFAERCMHNLSIRAYDCLGHMVYHQNQTFYVDHGPRGDSSEATQVIQDVFFTDEDVWALGGGFIPGDWIDIYVVPDRDWTDGDAIQPPNDVSNGVENVQADVNGDVHALVWPQPLIVGAYDIVYDADEDGFYDWGTDAIDGMSPGFIVRGTWDGVGGEGPSQVPIVSPLGLIVLTSILPLIGIIALRKKKQ
jgi:hypothetical protein